MLVRVKICLPNASTGTCLIFKALSNKDVEYGNVKIIKTSSYIPILKMCLKNIMFLNVHLCFWILCVYMFKGVLTS